MIEIKNRLPTKPNRWKITHESDSSQEYITWDYADEPTEVGTPINKATLEGIQTDLMDETKLVVAEYTVTEAVASVEFTNLDFAADGGFYEIIISGKQSNTGSSAIFYLQINDITSGYYTAQVSNSNWSPSVSDKQGFRIGYTRAGIQAIAYLSKVDNYYLCNCLTTYKSTSGNDISFAPSIGSLSSSANATKLRIVCDSSYLVAAGTNIKIVKRR